MIPLFLCPSTFAVRANIPPHTTFRTANIFNVFVVSTTKKHHIFTSQTTIMLFRVSSPIFSAQNSLLAEFHSARKIWWLMNNVVTL